MVALYDWRMTAEEHYRETTGDRFGVRLEPTIFHDAVHPSHIVLPVMPPPERVGAGNPDTPTAAAHPPQSLLISVDGATLLACPLLKGSCRAGGGLSRGA